MPSSGCHGFHSIQQPSIQRPQLAHGITGEVFEASLQLLQAEWPRATAGWRRPNSRVMACGRRPQCPACGRHPNGIVSVIVACISGAVSTLTVYVGWGTDSMRAEEDTPVHLLHEHHLYSHRIEVAMQEPSKLTTATSPRHAWPD